MAAPSAPNPKFLAGAFGASSLFLFGGALTFLFRQRLQRRLQLFLAAPSPLAPKFFGGAFLASCQFLRRLLRRWLHGFSVLPSARIQFFSAAPSARAPYFRLAGPYACQRPIFVRRRLLNFAAVPPTLAPIFVRRRLPFFSVAPSAPVPICVRRCLWRLLSFLGRHRQRRDGSFFFSGAFSVGSIFVSMAHTERVPIFSSGAFGVWFPNLPLAPSAPAPKLVGLALGDGS